jgi:hypothetical protein
MCSQLTAARLILLCIRVRTVHSAAIYHVPHKASVSCHEYHFCTPTFTVWGLVLHLDPEFNWRTVNFASNMMRMPCIVPQAGHTPAKLNTIIQPLMGGLRREPDPIIRQCTAEALAAFVRACIDRTPSPNDRYARLCGKIYLYWIGHALDTTEMRIEILLGLPRKMISSGVVLHTQLYEGPGSSCHLTCLIVR